MRQEKFMKYIAIDTVPSNLTYGPVDEHGMRKSNKIRGILQSAINPNPGKEKRDYYIKYNTLQDTYFIKSEGYTESLRYMGQNFKWSIWLDK